MLNYVLCKIEWIFQLKMSKAVTNFCLLLYTYILTHVIKVINSFPIFHQYVVWGYLYSPIHNIPYCLRAVRKRSLYFPSFPNFDKGPSVRVIMPTLKATLWKQDFVEFLILTCICFSELLSPCNCIHLWDQLPLPGSVPAQELLLQWSVTWASVDIIQ